MIAGPTHPFMPNTTLAGLGLILGAVGFAGVSWILLKTANNQLDLRSEPVSAGQPWRIRSRYSFRSPVSPSRPPLPTISGGGDGFSFTPGSRSLSPPGTVRM